MSNETEQPDAEDAGNNPEDAAEDLVGTEMAEDNRSDVETQEFFEGPDGETTYEALVREIGEEASGKIHTIQEILAMPGQPFSPDSVLADGMQERIRKTLNPLGDYTSAFSKAVNPLGDLTSAMSRVINPLGDPNSPLSKAMNPLVPALQSLSKLPGFDLTKVRPFPMDTLFALQDLTSLGKNQQNLFQEILQTPSWIETLDIFAEQRKGWGQLLGVLQQPNFARSTQDFLATSEGLRYTANRTVWHYTSGYALMQVLSKDYLWSSAPQNLNDASEVKHGLGVINQAFEDAQAKLLEGADDDGQRLRKKIKKGDRKKVKRSVREVMDKDYFKNAMTEIYIISGSSDDDSLTLFRNYANGDGFALGFDPQIELSAEGLVLDPDADEDDVPTSTRRVSGWYRVHYTDPKKKALAEEFVENAITDIIATDIDDIPSLVTEMRRHILILASTMKHKAFRDESEVRYITTNWSPAEGLVHYEHARTSIVPVLHVRTTSDDQNALLPLRGIRCSPVAPGGIVRTMEGLLVQQGYKKASKNVRKSKQPFKG